jgi:hypothetical protein
VRRPAGPWSPFVHALLESVVPLGLAPVPVALDESWETVTWIDGVAGERPLSDDVRSDEALVSVARLLRAIHDAFDGAVCHNDVGPWNVIFEGRDAVGLIDWDLAGPGPRIWDVAGAAWHFVPLYDDAECLRIGWPSVPDRMRRVELFVAAYGLPMARAALFEAVADRQRWYLDQVLTARACPSAPGSAPWLKVEPDLVGRDMAFLSGMRGGIAEVGSRG